MAIKRFERMGFMEKNGRHVINGRELHCGDVLTYNGGEKTHAVRYEWGPEGPYWVISDDGKTMPVQPYDEVTWDLNARGQP